MGIDYSYSFFYRRSQLRGALEAISAIADQSGGDKAVVLFPDDDLTIPFGEGRPIAFDAEPDKWHLCGSLVFTADQAIRDYLSAYVITVDEGQTASIGCIYLTVYSHQNSESTTQYDPDLIMIDLSAATSSMSQLFVDSLSIRESMRGVARESAAEYVLLDREDPADLIWWQGSPVSITVPGASTPQGELAKIVNEYSTD